MKTTIIALFAALVLVPATVAAPPPGVTADPTTNYVLTRVLPNGNEKDLATFQVTDWEQSTLIREVALQAARQNRVNNPSWRLILYGPVDPPVTYWTDDDRVWDSATDL